MSSADRAAELRLQAERLETLHGLEEQLTAAKAAHRESPTAETRAAVKAASHALREARWSARGGEGTFVEHLAGRKASRGEV